MPKKKTSRNAPNKTVWPWQKKQATNASLSLEEVIGGNWLQKVGVLMLMLGMAYFLKYSFEQGWFGAAMQVGIGILIGLLLITAGTIFEKKYKQWSHILCGAGIGILYLSLFSGHSEFALFSNVTCFIAMLPVTVFAGFLAVRYNSLALAFIATLGGFSAPALSSGAEPHYLFTMSYSLLLSLAIFGIAFFKRWPLLNYLAFAFSAIYFELCTIAQANGEIPINATLGFLGAFFLLFSVLSFYPKALKKITLDPWSLCLLVLNGIFTYSHLYRLLGSNLNELTIGISVLGLLYLIESVVAYRKNEKDQALVYTLLGSSIVVFTTILPIQAEAYPLTLGLLLETLVLFYIGFKFKMVWLRRIGTILGIVSFAYVLNNSAISDFTELAFLNKENILLALSALIYGFIAWLYNRSKKETSPSERHVFAVALLASNLSFFNLLLLEVNHGLALNALTDSILGLVTLATLSILYGTFLLKQGYLFSTKIMKFIGLILWITGLTSILEAISKLYLDASSFVNLDHGLSILSVLILILCIRFVKRMELNTKTKGSHLPTLFKLSTVVLLFISLNFEINFFFHLEPNLILARTASFSIAWALFSIAYLVFGIIKKERIYRWTGLSIFGLTILKVLTVDIIELSSIYRVVAFMILGILMILSSYLYQRHKKLIQEKLI